MNTIFELINPDNTLSVNRRLAHSIGLAEAVVYAALLAKFCWYERHGMLSEGGWFYSTADDLYESTALSAKQQRRCISTLAEAGLIRCRRIGMPAKRYFSIVDDVSLLERLMGLPAEPAAEEPADSTDKRAEQAEPNGESRKNQSVTSSSAEREDKTKVNKTKENKQEQVKQDVREQIRYRELCERYGESFADLAADVVSEGASGSLGAAQLKTDGRTIPQEEIISVFSRVDYDAVRHVAEYISQKGGNIRSLRAYLRSALFTAAVELSQKPRSAAADSHGIESDILEELREMYCV